MSLLTRPVGAARPSTARYGRLPIMQESSTSPALVTALCNQKGGVGKTTSTVNLARAASVQGRKTLVIDLDPQGNSTSALAQDDIPKDEVGIADVLAPSAAMPIQDVLVPTIWSGVMLAPSPSTEALAQAGTQVESMRAGREFRLVEALRPVLPDFDLILIDNSPALGMLLINALTASHLALIITQPEQWSADALPELTQTIDLVAQHYNQTLRTVGPLINGKAHNAHHERVLSEIVDHYGSDAWTDPDDLIPLRTAIRDYPIAGLGLDQGKEQWQRDAAAAYGRMIERMFTTGGRT